MPFGIENEKLTDEVVGPLQQMRVASFKTQYNHITLQPNWPDSLRWNSTPNSGTISDGEVKTTGSGQTPIVKTRDRANYAPGAPAVFGIGSKISDDPTGDQFVEWGADDGTDSMGFGKDSTGPYIYYENGGGGQTKVYKTDQGQGGWNGETPRGFNDFNNQRISWIDHLWYKGGPVAWRSLDYYDFPENIQMRTLHMEKPPVIDNPNLPIKAEVDSSNDSSNCTLKLDAAHYMKSDDESENRVNGQEFKDVSVGTSGWTYLASFQKKSNWEVVEVNPTNIEASSDQNPALISLQFNASLSSTSFSEPPNTSSSETAVESDNSGSISTTGERRWIGFIPSGGGGGKFTAVTSRNVNLRVPETQNLTLAAQAIGGSTNLNGVLGWKESF